MESSDLLHRKQRLEELKDTVSTEVDFVMELHAFLITDNGQMLPTEELSLVLNDRLKAFIEANNFTEETPLIQKLRKNIEYIIKLREQSVSLETLYNEANLDFKNFINNLFRKQFNNLFKKPSSHELNYFDYVRGVNFKGIAVELILSNDLREKVADLSSSIGAAFSGLPIYFVFENSPEEAYKHEFNHVLYDMHDSNMNHNTELVVHFVKQDIEQVLQASNPIAFDIFSDFLSSEIEKIEERLFGEFLADIDSFFSDAKIFGYYKHLRQVLSQLKMLKIADGEKNKEQIEKILSVSISHLELKLLKKVNQLKLIVGCAAKFNMQEECKASVILFGRDLYKTIRYIRHKVGDKAFDEVSSTFQEEDKSILYAEPKVFKGNKPNALSGF
jgi:hypothetical protein